MCQQTNEIDSFSKTEQKQIQQTIKSISSQNLTKTRKHVLGSSKQENLSLAIIVLQIDKFLFVNIARTGSY